MKKHKIEFTREEIHKLWLALGYYCHMAVEQDNYHMLVEREVIAKIRAILHRRLFEFGFSEKPSAKVLLTQLHVDMIWKTQGQNAELRDALMKIGSKTHSYAA